MAASGTRGAGSAVIMLGLLLSAFAPMIAALGIVRFGLRSLIGIVLVALAILAVVLLALVLGSARGIQERSVQPVQARHADERVLAFTSGYLVPVVIAAFAADRYGLVGAILITVMLAVIYVRSRLVHLNPVLALLGYRLYEITLESGATLMLLTRQARLDQRSPIRCRFLTDDIAIQFRGS